MNVEVELPDFGVPGGGDGRVAAWHFEENEHVEEGEILMEVLCEMTSCEVPAPCSGILVEQLVGEDEIVRIGEPLALIDSDEEIGLDEDSDR